MFSLKISAQFAENGVFFFSKPTSLICFKTVLIFFMVAIGSRAKADWSSKIGTNVYYTDDVALFSVTRRLSLKDDPTQPVVDRPSQEEDFVVEPSAELEWAGQNALGELNWSLEAGGYVFVDQSAFTRSAIVADLLNGDQSQSAVQFCA